MRASTILLLLFIACADRLSAQVIQYEIDASLNSELLFNRGSISDLHHTNINTIMVMGMFAGVNSPLQAGAMISESGDLYSPISIGGRRVLSYKYEYLQFGQGIRRFDIPGGTNQNFRFEFQKPAYSGPLPNKALDVLVTPEDNILVAGRFFTDSTLMGTAESHLGLRQLCMIDSTGAPVVGFPMLRCAEPVSAEISTIHQLSTGEYIIAGDFDEVDGYPYAKLAKLNADFSVNTDFGHVFETNGSLVFTTLIDSQDRIWVIFGDDITILDNSGYASRNIRLLSNGNIDSSFAPPICTYYNSGTYENPMTPGIIAAGVIEDDDGTFILSGYFIDVNGENHRRLVKIDDTGTVISNAFQYLGADSAVWGTWNDFYGPVMSAGIRVIEKLPDGKLLIGGQFSSFGGEPYSCLVRLQPNGFVGVDEKEGRGKLKIWPNPFSVNGASRLRSMTGSGDKLLNIALPDVNETIERVEIVDLQGRTVVAYQGYLDFSGIDVTTLNAGIYVVRAWSEQGVYTQKVILE
jgi:hypothetical protein